jgi:hypothetical protein
MATNIPDSPIGSIAAWLGVKQAKRNDWIYVLSAAEKAERDSAIHAFRRVRQSTGRNHRIGVSTSGARSCDCGVDA